MRMAFGLVAFWTVCLGLAGSAVAQPCSVNIAHAPDDVRDVVQHWVAGETRCRPDLEVRIVPTDGGYYLFARDSSGQVRERIVPDAQSAGVLVASWVADDGIVAGPPDEAEPPPSAPSSVPSTEVMPTGTSVVAATTPQRNSAVHLQAGAMLGSIYGARVDLDTTRRGRFVFGLSVGADAAKAYDQTYDWLTVRDLDALLYVGAVFQHGKLWLRLQLGAGVITSEFNAAIWSGSTVMEPTGGDTSALLEGSARLGVDLGAWTISAGPLARVYRQQWSSGNQFEVQRDGDVSAYLGVGRRL